MLRDSNLGGGESHRCDYKSSMRCQGGVEGRFFFPQRVFALPGQVFGLIKVEEVFLLSAHNHYIC